MRKKTIVTIGLAILLSCLAGCGHKLVAHNGDTTVNVYASKDQFDKVKAMKAEGGAAGMIGGLGESMLAKKVAADAPVSVLASDSEGASIEVTDGPDKGLKGYIAKDNLD